MSLLRADATPETAETHCAAQPLPLFRPEVLCRQEKFFGEPLFVRSFSVPFLASFIAGAAVIACSALFFGKYTEMIPVQGVLLRGPALEGSSAPASGRHASVAVFQLPIAITPGAHLAIRCFHCAHPGAEFPATVCRVSRFAAPATIADSLEARQLVDFSYETPFPFQQLPAFGTRVEILVPVGRRRLFELFRPSLIHGPSHS
jgi:hypothetical protein